jgi:hypothetical protein
MALTLHRDADEHLYFSSEITPRGVAGGGEESAGESAGRDRLNNRV